jgi:hypothetical protein
MNVVSLYVMTVLVREKENKTRDNIKKNEIMRIKVYCNRVYEEPENNIVCCIVTV